jgi:octaprenyl-diphosphate synthase
VLVGDFLFSRAFQLMVEDGSLKVLGILSHASAVIAEGEVLQLVTSNDTATDEDAYLAVIRAKTAQLFAAASQIGAVIAGRPENEEAALTAFGLNLGIAFQLVDDMLDYSARQAELGKTVGDDFRDGKITLPIVLAFRRGDEQERRFWRRTLEKSEQSEDDLDRAIALLHKHGALRETLDRARHYGAQARAALAGFADCAEKRALIEAVDFCLARGY